MQFDKVTKMSLNCTPARPRCRMYLSKVTAVCRAWCSSHSPPPHDGSPDHQGLFSCLDHAGAPTINTHTCPVLCPGSSLWKGQEPRSAGGPSTRIRPEADSPWSLWKERGGSSHSRHMASRSAVVSAVKSHGVCSD